MSEGELAPVVDPKPATLALSGEADRVAAMLNLALEKGISPEGLEKLVAMQERLIDRAAAAACGAALRAFKSECPQIPKSEQIEVKERSGTGVAYTYRFAPLDAIAKVIDPLLFKHGLSYTWDSEVDDKGRLVCTCIVRHEGGGEVRASFTCALSGSPTMSDAQKAGGTLTFARRYSLVQVLGLTMTDPDDDAAPDAPSDPITKDQALTLHTLLKDTASNIPAFLKIFRVSSLEEIKATDYARAIGMVREKQSQQGRGR